MRQEVVRIDLEDPRSGGPTTSRASSARRPAKDADDLVALSYGLPRKLVETNPGAAQAVCPMDRRDKPFSVDSALDQLLPSRSRGGARSSFAVALASEVHVPLLPEEEPQPSCLRQSSNINRLHTSMPSCTSPLRWPRRVLSRSGTL